MKNQILKSKKADERYLFIWMIINWVIIGVSIMIGVSMFYSTQADARLAEASILSDNVLSCLSQDFKFSEVSSENFDIYSKCNLNKKSVGESDLYYIKINITSAEKTEKMIKIGNTAYDVLCKPLAEQQKNFPQCITKNLEIEDSVTKIKYNLSVLAASNQG